MRTKTILTNGDIKKIATAAERHASARNWPVIIAICDDGGHPLYLNRLDGATLSSIEMALAKARTSALGRRESKFYEDLIEQGRFAFLSTPMTGLLQGGLPIVVADEVVGSVGVSGVTSEEDAEIARAGIAALELPETC